MRALVAGHLCLDLRPMLTHEPTREPGQLDLVGPAEVTLGGCVSTTGTALAARGVSVSQAAAAGIDALADLTMALLERTGVDISRVHRVEHPASYTVILEPPGADRMFWHHTGANDHFDGSEVDVDGVDLLHLGYPSLLPALVVEDGMPLARLFEAARARGVITSLDLAVIDGERRDVQGWERFLARVLPVTDVITPSTDDLASAIGTPVAATSEELTRAAQWLVDLGAGTAMVSGGAQGAGWATRAGDQGATPALPVTRVRGTTGAGDTSTAAFLAARLCGESVEMAAAAAMEAAAAHISG